MNERCYHARQSLVNLLRKHDRLMNNIPLYADDRDDWERLAKMVEENITYRRYEMDVIKEILSLKQRHYYCEDSWYSCPLAEDGCCDDTVDKNKCRCGAEDQHKKIDDIIEELYRLGIGDSQNVQQCSCGGPYER